MRTKTIIGVAVAPLVSYAVVLAAVFIGTIVAGQMTVVEAWRSLLLILAKSVSLGHLCIYLVMAAPAAAVPWLLQQPAAGTLANPSIRALRLIVAILLVSVVPTIISAIVMDPVRGLLLGLAAGTLSVTAIAVIGRHNRRQRTGLAAASELHLEPNRPWHEERGGASFGKRNA